MVHRYIHTYIHTDLHTLHTYISIYLSIYLSLSLYIYTTFYGPTFLPHIHPIPYIPPIPPYPPFSHTYPLCSPILSITPYPSIPHYGPSEFTVKSDTTVLTAVDCEAKLSFCCAEFGISIFREFINTDEIGVSTALDFSNLVSCLEEAWYLCCICPIIPDTCTSNVTSLEAMATHRRPDNATSLPL